MDIPAGLAAVYPITIVVIIQTNQKIVEVIATSSS